MGSGFRRNDRSVARLFLKFSLGPHASVSFPGHSLVARRGFTLRFFPTSKRQVWTTRPASCSGKTGIDSWRSTSRPCSISRSTSTRSSARCCCSCGRRIASIRAVAWWGIGAPHARALGRAATGSTEPYRILSRSISSNAILLSSYAVTWNGARVFDGRATRPGSLIAGAAIWVGICLWPGFNADPHLRGFVSALIVGDLRVAHAPTSSGAGAPSGWCRAGRRSSSCSRTARCSCCAARSRILVNAADRQSPVLQRMAERAQRRVAAVPDLDRVHPAGDGEGARRADAQDRRQARSRSPACPTAARSCRTPTSCA